MTKLMIVLPLLAACPAKDLSSSKIKLAEMQVRKLADEAYPQWVMANPGCPSVDDLTTFLGDKDLGIDPWGSKIEILCGPTAPAGVKGIGARSAGYDQKQGTSDDVKSW